MTPSSQSGGTDANTKQGSPRSPKSLKSPRQRRSIPINKFWNNIPESICSTFLRCFSLSELQDQPINPNSLDSAQDKMKLLLKLLRDKHANLEKAAAPRTLHDLSIDGWEVLLTSIYTIEDELEDKTADETLQKLLNGRRDKSDLSYIHALSGRLLKSGKYKEAEETARPVLAWVDARMGKASPYSLSSRRTIAEAVWRQEPSRQREAEEMFVEMQGLVEELGDSRYAIYQEGERQMTLDLLTRLRRISGQEQKASSTPPPS